MRKFCRESIPGKFRLKLRYFLFFFAIEVNKKSNQELILISLCENWSMSSVGSTQNLGNFSSTSLGKLT